MTYLYVQRSNYYYKRKIPHTLHNLVCSLHTDSLTTAKKLLAIINAKSLHLFTSIRKGECMDIPRVKALVNKYIQEAIQEYSELESLRHKYFALKEDGKTYAGHSQTAIEKAQERINDVLDMEDDEQLTAEAQKIFIRSNITQDELDSLSNNEKRVLYYELLKGEYNVLSYDLKRNKARLEEALNAPIDQSFQAFADNGVSDRLINSIADSFGKDGANLLLNAIASPQQQNNDRYHSKTIMEILEEFIEHKTITQNITEPFRYRTDVEIFIKIIGKEYWTDVTHEDFTKYMQALAFLPIQTKYKKLFEEQDITEILRLSKEDKLSNEPKIDRIQGSTLIKKIININALVDFAVDNEYLDRNRLKPKTKNMKGKASDTRKEFRPEQLRSLFMSKWYSSDFDKNVKKYPSRIWIPLILIYNGFRINEIAQIYNNQIVIRDDIYMFRIAIDNQDQQLKNVASKRTIPIHPKLIELGFLDFWESQKSKGYARLFQELYHTNTKGYGQAFSKVFNDKKFKESWLEEETMKKLNEKVIKLDLHSFRHGFSGQLKGIIEEDTREYFLGHSAGDYDYGNIKPIPAYENISKCIYNLDLTELSKKLHTAYNSENKL